jgi:hypothetical protein
MKTTVGSAVYAPELNAVIWKIKQFPGGKEFLMRAHFGLPSVRNGKAVLFSRVVLIFLILNAM